MSEAMDVHKVTLSSNKVVYLRDMKIRDQEMAAKAAGSSVGSDNEVALGAAMQKELLKMLLVKINEKRPSGQEKEDLDGLFSYREYTELMRAIARITGLDGEMGNLQIELTTSGEI